MRWVFFLLFGLGGAWVLAQAPPNDPCANASLVTFTNNGYDTGTFYSDTVDITSATLQPGEYIPPGVPNGKTVWYRFYVPTTRTIRIILRQVGTSIDPTKAGWTLYRTSACLPGAAQRVDPPIVIMEGYTHACLTRGWYFVQVGADLAVSGQIFLEFQVSAPLISAGAEAYYDHAATAQNLGLVATSSSSVLVKDVTFDAACQSVFSGEALCDNDSSWSKSSWHVFRTDGHIDWLGIGLQEDPWNSANTSPREWRLFLYKGDARTDSNSLVLIAGCVPLTQVANGQEARADFLCELEPNTYYTIRILYRTGYANRVRLRLYERGNGASISPNPTTIPPSHQLGTLTYGPTYTISDSWSCEARISQNNCGGTLTPSDTIDGYDLAVYFTFTLTGAAHVYLEYTNPWWYYYCTSSPRFRVFQGNAPVDGCNLPLIFQQDGGGWYYCMPAGTYTVQVLGRIERARLWGTCSSPYPHLGLPFQVRIQLGSTPQQLFGLHAPTEADLINGGSPLLPGPTYNATRDTIDCRTTVLPAGDVCGSANDRAIYRIIEIGQPGILEVGGGNWWRFRYRLYRGDARTAPVVGGRLQGLIDQVGCQDLYYPFKVCVTPGTYTLVSFADAGDIGETDRPWFRFYAFPSADWRFYDPTQPAQAGVGPGPQEVGTLSSASPSLTALWTRFTCEDNPLTILGYAPCYGATKQAYWEVYIADPSLVTFSPQYDILAWPENWVEWRTFRGRISDGSLTALERDCHGSYTACMSPGWYTIVAYAKGQTWTSPAYSGNRGGTIGNRVWFTISRDPRSQKFGSFATADRPGNLDWGPNSNTAYAPKLDRTYTLDWEYWSCANNLPFPPGITPCNPSHNRLSYRVFSVTKPSYMRINADLPSRLYQGDITALPPPYTIIHDCSSEMRICWLPPGTYTLVTFAGDAQIGTTTTPSFYVDSVDFSLHNYAAVAYDFGNIPPDNTEYRTKPGDPLGPYGRPGSTDWIFCTTDAFASDPSSNCPLGVDNNTPPSDNPPTGLPDRRRNLWYTFTVSDPGQVYVSVYAQTPGSCCLAFSVYQSDDFGYNPPTVVDSTTAQGLTLVATSQYWWWCCSQHQTVSFYRDPCTNVPRRYYVVVNRNTCDKEPNIQIEVGIRVEPLPPLFVLYDHYSDANVISGDPTTICAPPYPAAALGAGTYTGCQGDLTCATKDVTDQNTCGVRTLWYTFTSDITGYVYLNYDRPGVESYRYNPDDIQLYYQLIPGDSTSSGLIRVPLEDDWWTHPTLGYRRWGRACVRAGGRYYIMLTGCNHLGYVVPRIWLQKHEGDFCRDSVTITVSAPGTYSTNLLISCFTIGESPGEADTTMGCLGSPIGRKSAWVLVENMTSDTMDFDVQIIENTTALGSQVQYRVMTGDCNAMNQDECVREGAYITLHLKCRPPMQSFWVHIVMPEWATGDITVEITANPISQTCVPPNPDCPIARFDAISGCIGEAVQFLNYSSVGPGISYYWDFGDGFTSTLFAPQHYYAVPDTYLVRLIVDNGTCRDTGYKQVIVYPKPGVSFTYTPSAPVWVGVPINLFPVYQDTLPGMGQYIYWDFCAGGSPCGAMPTDYIGPLPGSVVYNAAGTKRICVTVTNGLVCDSVYCVDIPVIYPPLGGGPYDGAAVASFVSTCPTLSYAGGPYDGAGLSRFFAGCAWPVAGGPYDGAAVVRAPALQGRDTFACVGSPIEVHASGLVDWYTVPSGGTPIATGTASLSIPSLSATQLYYLEGACTGSGRLPVLVTAIQPLAASFSVSPGPYCPNQPVYFSNQTLVAGASQPTIGSLIVGTGTPGTPGRIAFSSSSQLNFSQLYDGVCQNGTAWTANNSGPGTTWAIWTYVMPMSVNRIVLCQCQTCPNAFQRSPVLGRLYYDNGSGWQLVKLIHFPYPFTGWYDTGPFVEAQGVFATRWKLEFDVNAAQAPALGELQIYASYPVIGGNIQWSFDGGGTWVSGGNASYTFSAAGTYTIQMVANAPGACPDTATATITVDPCGPLPTVQSLLAARPMQGALVALSWRASLPAQWARLERLRDTSWVPLYTHSIQGAQSFTWVDSFPAFGRPNVYRVVSEHGLASLVYSNLAEVALDPSVIGSEDFVRAYPNPVTDEVRLQLGLTGDRLISGAVYDAKGALVAYLPLEAMPAGLHERTLLTSHWATGVYTLRLSIGDKVHTLLLLKMIP